ncbi:MAG: hypothetical protein ACREDR_12855, partial [Blastocatellia bacterium]
ANLVGTSVGKLNPKLPGNQYFSPGNFTGGNAGDYPTTAAVMANPALRTYGTLPRNFFNGPGTTNIDMSIIKNTKIRERVNVQFRADFFNLLNHAEFSNPNLNISSQNFGKIQDTADPRIIQFALRFAF